MLANNIINYILSFLFYLLTVVWACSGSELDCGVLPQLSYSLANEQVRTLCRLFSNETLAALTRSVERAFLNWVHLSKSWNLVALAPSSRLKQRQKNLMLHSLTATSLLLLPLDFTTRSLILLSPPKNSQIFLQSPCTGKVDLGLRV